MRLRLSLRFADEQSVPIHYNYWLQSALYQAMGTGAGARVHDSGFEGEILIPELLR